MRESIIFYRSFHEAIRELPNDVQVQVYNALFEYSLNGRVIELSGIAKTVFTLIKPQLDANQKRFENGNKGGRPKTKIKPKQNQNETEPEANNNVNDNVNVNDNDNVSSAAEVIPITSPFTTNILPAWQKWLSYKKTEHHFKYKSEESKAAALAELFSLSAGNEETASKIINQSIAKGWKGFFPLNNNGTEKDTAKNKTVQEYGL